MNNSICIITSYCGESQYEECVNSVKHQKDIQKNHIIIENRSFLDSQIDTFENAINTDYKFVCKLDADMVLPDEYYLRDLISEFNENIDRLFVLVDDFYSKRKIVGMHIIRQSAIKEHFINKITLPQPDLWINQINKFKKVELKGRFVKHGFNPTDEQLYRYGYSRGKKLFSQRKGVNLFVTFATILESKNHIILQGYSDALGCKNIEEIDSLKKLFSYLKFNFLEYSGLYIKVKLVKCFM